MYEREFGSSFVEQKTRLNVRVYNLVMGLTILYGLIVNLILCVLIPDITVYINPMMFLILYFVCAFSGIAIANKSSNPLVSFIGYNMVVVPIGLVVSMSIQEYGGLSSDIVLYAFMYTLIITGIMVTASTIWPNFFQTLGRFLFLSLVSIIIMSIFELFLGEFILISWFAAVIFSLYIGYDFLKAQELDYTIDNAIDSAVSIYLDIINLFLRILRILGNSRDD